MSLRKNMGCILAKLCEGLIIILENLGNVGIQPTNPHRVESYSARLLIEEEVYTLRSKELQKV